MPALPALPLLHPSVFLLGTGGRGGVLRREGKKKGREGKVFQNFIFGVFGDGGGVGGEGGGGGGTERWDGKGWEGGKGLS